ncbi:MAG TPA: hypothetical protein VN622_07575, partial [Clostridia bacterium]|nr:hypothetical protein [Clostridia bacterium]
MTSRKLLLSLVVLVIGVAPMLAQKGNGLPSGMKKAYNLEVIAYSGDNCPSGDFTESNTHRIAVKADVNDNPNGVLLSALVRQNDIMLAEGPDFR